MVYVLLLALLWAAVGALVYFVRANITLSQRVALTAAVSLVFGIIGWVDMSSIYHAPHAASSVIAKELGQIGFRSSKGAN
jgi:hypothetical protein